MAEIPRIPFFLVLTSADDSMKVYVNMDNIVFFEEMIPIDQNCTRLYYHGGDESFIDVREKASKIFDLISEAY